MMEYKFLIATTDIKGLPGLSKGDAVLPAATEIIDNYEYDVWHVINGGGVAKTRHEHVNDLSTFSVDGKDMSEIRAKIDAISDAMKGNLT